MNILDQWWKRLLISFVLGGVASQLLGFLSFSTIEISTIICTIIIYLLLTRLYERNGESDNSNQPN